MTMWSWWRRWTSTHETNEECSRIGSCGVLRLGKPGRTDVQYGYNRMITCRNSNVTAFAQSLRQTISSSWLSCGFNIRRPPNLSSHRYSGSMPPKLSNLEPSRTSQYLPESCGIFNQLQICISSDLIKDA